MKWTPAIACALLGAMAGAGGATRAKADPIEFNVKHVPGRVERLKIVSKTVGTMKMFDPMPEQKFTQTFEQELVGTCKKINPDKSAVYELAMPRICMNSNVGGFRMDVSVPPKAANEGAAFPGSDMIQKVFEGIAKLKLTLTVSPEGKPLKLEGMREGIKKIMDEIGDMEPMVKGIITKISSMFDDETIAQQMKSYWRMIPPKGPVNVGDTWEEDWDMTLPVVNARFQGHGQYELVGVEAFRGRSCAKIRVTESFKTVPRPKTEESKTPTSSPASGSDPIQAMMEKMEFHFESSGGEGIAYVDYQNGDLVQLRQTQKMTIRMKIPIPTTQQGQAASGTMSMVQKLNTSISIDSIDEKAAKAENP